MQILNVFSCHTVVHYMRYKSAWQTEQLITWTLYSNNIHTTPNSINIENICFSLLLRILRAHRILTLTHTCTIPLNRFICMMYMIWPELYVFAVTIATWLFLYLMHIWQFHIQIKCSHRCMKTKRNVKSRSLVRTHTHWLTYTRGTHAENSSKQNMDQDKYSQRSHA